ncbi:MAG: cadherin repeat domain-containing protein [Pseudomonadota bacterium]
MSETWTEVVQPADESWTDATALQPPVLNDITFNTDEAQEIGAFVGTVAAVTPLQVFYRFKNNPGNFSINIHTGDVRVAAALSNTTQPVHTLTVQAMTDRGNTEATLTINVEPAGFVKTPQPIDTGEGVIDEPVVDEAGNSDPEPVPDPIPDPDPTPTGFDISAIPGMVDWFSARLASESTLSGSEVTAVTNRISGGPSLTTGASRPERVESVVNGHAAFRFGGGQDHFLRPSSSDLANFFANGGFFFMVIPPFAEIPDSPSELAFPRLFALTDDCYVGFSRHSATHANVEFAFRTSGTDLITGTTDGPIDRSQRTILTGTYDKSSNQNRPEFYANGTALVFVDQHVPSAPANDITGQDLCIGNRAQNLGNTEFFNRGFVGDIAEWGFGAQTPSQADHKAVIDTLAAANQYNVTVANPFRPTVVAASLTVPDTAVAGHIVGTLEVTQSPTTVSLIGANASKFTLDGLVIKMAANVTDTVGTDLSVTAYVENAFGNNSAAITITVVDNTTVALAYARPAAYDDTSQAIIFRRPASGNITYNPGDTVVDIDGNSKTIQSNSIVVVRGPAGVPCTANYTRVENVAEAAFIGMELRPSNRDQDRVLGAFNIAGRIWLEGILAYPAWTQDFLQFDCDNKNAGRDVYIQRCAALGMNGLQSTKHPDFVQPLGPFNHIYMDTFLAESGYQGIFLDIQPSASGADYNGHTISNGDLWHLNLDPNVGHQFSFLMWSDAGLSQPSTITNVWCTRKNGQTPPNGLAAPQGNWSWDAGTETLTVSATNLTGSMVAKNQKPPRTPWLDIGTIGIDYQ